MKPRWNEGEAVRLIRNVRNDGTYPGLPTGAALVRRGSVGHVVDVGTFLQDQVIYSVHFLDQGRIVGCREEELIGAEEEWIPSRHEFREKVRTRAALTVGGTRLVEPEDVGEIIKVIRHGAAGVAYQVHFESLAGRVLLVPESLLETAEPAGECLAGLC